MAIYRKLIGFGKRKIGVSANKKIKRGMVQAIVKKLKAEGKAIDLQAINKEVYNKVRRKRQSRQPKHK